jgi:type II secretory pathway pseudopilin PulG
MKISFHACRGKQAGTSLVEILVVIAIIAILIGILLPALARGRELSVRVQCESNVHQIMLASLGYANENHFYLPYPNWSGADSIYHGAGWLYLPNGQALTESRVQTSVLWPWLKSAAVYKCKLDQGPFAAGSAHLLTSYIMNGAVCGYGNPNAMPSFKVQKFRPDAVIFWEGDGTSITGVGWNDGSNFPTEGTTVRHNRGSCVAVIDGHVDWLTSKTYAVQLARSPGPLWCNPATANGHQSVARSTDDDK